MCFVPVEGEDDTYRHVNKNFVQAVNVDQAKLQEIAKILNIRKIARWQPGKLLLVSDDKKSRVRKKR